MNFPRRRGIVVVRVRRRQTEISDGVCLAVLNSKAFACLFWVITFMTSYDVQHYMIPSGEHALEEHVVMHIVS